MSTPPGVADAQLTALTERVQDAGTEADDSGINDDDDCPEHGLSGPEIIPKLEGLTPEGGTDLTTSTLVHNRHMNSGVLSGLAMVAPTKGEAATGLVTTPVISHFWHGRQIKPPNCQLFIGATSHYGRTDDVHLLREAVLGVCYYGPHLFAFFTGDFMFRFAVKRTDTGFPRLLMVETVFPVYRRLRTIIRSACVVVTVEKNGLWLSDDAFCVQIRPDSFVICVERFGYSNFNIFSLHLEQLSIGYGRRQSH